MHFDYLLKEGKSSVTNALSLLEAAGYPPEVARHASETAQKIASSSIAGK
jgi:DNA mismatch repair ATPase MutS